MWERGSLGSDTLKTLRKTLLYLVKLHFALRGAKQYSLLYGENSQLKVGIDKVS